MKLKYLAFLCLASLMLGLVGCTNKDNKPGSSSMNSSSLEVTVPEITVPDLTDMIPESSKDMAPGSSNDVLPDGTSGNTNMNTQDSTSAVDTNASTAPLSGDSVNVIDNLAKIDQLSGEKIQFGHGLRTDDNNRPVDTVDFQQKYGDLGGIFIESEKEKKIYLTFDEGYENGFTAPILATLKEKNVKATFFVTYHYVRDNPKLIQQMIDGGHVVANHSYNHPSLPECSNDEVKSEIMDLHDYVKENFKINMNLIRPPKGEFSEKTLAITQGLGYKTVLWSFAYHDWDVNKQPDKASAFEKITSSTHNGGVYLLHAVSKTNAEVLGDVIDYWHDNGYELALL